MVELDVFTPIVPPGWQLNRVLEVSARAATYRSLHHLPMSAETVKFVEGAFPSGLYAHQVEALEVFCCSTDNLCIATGTGSGKSEVFQLSARQVLEKDPAARVLAVYPMKALGREQTDRWRTFFQQSGEIEGKPIRVGRIDGDVDTKERDKVLKECRVVIATPDIVHCWLIPRLAAGDVSGESCRRFLKKVRLVVIDEVHTYRGVFGTNSAFMFRRLRHITGKLGSALRFVAASATLAEGPRHLEELIGEPFTFIDETRTASPRPAIPIVLLTPPSPQDGINNAAVLSSLLRERGNRFVVFVDSRKATELIATVASREFDHADDSQRDGSTITNTGHSEAQGIPDSLEAQAQDDAHPLSTVLRTLHEQLPHDRSTILPYRAGFAAYDAEQIQSALKDGNLAGVISTSALELGLDIGRLTAVGLVGVPESATSLWQRIGRIRPQAGGGAVYLINDGKPRTRMIFKVPELLLNTPPARGALYLENEYIQYIHAMCLARPGGEDAAVEPNGDDNASFHSPIGLPENFTKLCNDERTYTVPPHLQHMKDYGLEKPHYAFPLRDCDVQFSLKCPVFGGETDLGSASWSQVMREAYPGAVYRYMKTPWRVVEVNRITRRITLRREKPYFTSPTALPPQFYPNMRINEGVIGGFRKGEVTALECKTQVCQRIVGWTERRGPSELRFEYARSEDLKRELNIRLEQRNFDRTVRTTGVFITWPEIASSGASIDQMAALLFEAMLNLIPFERADLTCGDSTVRSSEVLLPLGTRSIAICDFTSGGLRLSKVLTDLRILQQVVQGSLEMASVWPEEVFVIRQETLDSLRALEQRLCDVGIEFEEYGAGLSVSRAPGEGQRVLLAGSIGIVPNQLNRRVRVDKVFLRPEGLHYKVEYEEASMADKDQIKYLPVIAVEPVPGEARWGLYSDDTGEVVPLEEA